MKFKHIVGNPPYNNDLYIKFLDKLNNRYYTNDMIVIVPAKLYFNKNIDTEAFKELFKHIERCIFYQCEGEVFKINMASGISIFVIRNEKFDSTLVKNISNNFEVFNTDNYYEIDKTFKTFNIKALTIINKVLSISDSYKIQSNNLTKTYKCNVRKQAYVLGGSSNLARSIFYYDDKFDSGWVTNNFKIENDTVNCNGKITVFSSDNIEECESFISYINTRLVRYLIAVGTSGYSNIMCDDAFRFVPKPDSLNNIFNNEELYKKFRLTDEEIKLIESVIKSR